MRSIDDIKYICSDRFTTTNRIVAKTIFNKYDNENVPQVMAIHKLVNLKEQKIYGSTLQEEFFRILDENGYNKNFEIINLIYSLNNVKEIDKKNIIDKYLNSPYISKIEQNDKDYLIELDSLDVFRITSINSYLGVNPSFLSKIISGLCHTNIKYVLSYNPKFYSVTSFIRPIFGNGSCYHSYCLDQDNNKIIDPTYKIVMDKEEYEKLFQTEEIFKTKGSRLYDVSNTAIRHKFELKFYDSQIASTLFQQYIWENDLPSPNPSIFSKTPENKHLLIKNR